MNIEESGHGDTTPDDVLLARLRRLVELESPTGDTPALRRVGDVVVEELSALGARARWQTDETAAVCTIPGSPGRESESPILVPLHIDTVWPVGTLATMPFSVADGIVRGPGCFDMKGGIVVALEALRRIDSASHRPITVLLITDEEIGSPTSRGLIEGRARSACAVLGFEPPHPDGALKTARWGSTRLRISVTGREAHAALDAANGISAIDELVDQLVAVRAIVATAPGVLCNVGVIDGGALTNVVPGLAHADIGLRFPDAGTEEEVLERLAMLQPVRHGALVETELLSNRPAWEPDAVHDDLLARIAVAGRACGQRTEGRPATGAADTNLTGRLGVPSIDGLGPLGRGAHAAHEQVVASSLAERATLVAAILTAL